MLSRKNKTSELSSPCVGLEGIFCMYLVRSGTRINAAFEGRIAIAVVHHVSLHEFSLIILS